MEEIWKPVPGYENYFISNYGNLKRNNKFLKKRIDKYGYCRYALSKKQKPKSFMSHRLVLLSFVGESNLLVNHKDGNKLNNYIENLEYCTNSENVKHAYQIGLIHGRKGESHHFKKLKDSDILTIRSLIEKSLLSNADIARFYDVSTATISLIKNKKHWGHI